MSSDSEDENVIRYGTPLEPYEDDEVPAKKRCQESDQYALDDHGRRRFHGAFTGGFSAGYGNSVATPEGWAPSMFKSSRSEKAKISMQKAEDFMDEEDRSEFGIAPHKLQPSNEYSRQKISQKTKYYDGPIPGEPVLESLLKPVHETAAVKILKAMGWREGQGTGARLTQAGKQAASDQHKVYGCYLPPEMKQDKEVQSDDNDSDNDIDYDTLFAPDDYEPYLLEDKNDRFGLGYKGLSRHSVLGNLVGEYGDKPGSSKSHLKMKEKGKKVSIHGQAFGVGALEDDDEDIYGTEDMSHYDFELGGLLVEKPKGKPKTQEKNVLKGFVKSSKPLPSVASYPPPALPRDFTPATFGFRKTRFEPTNIEPRNQGLGRHELTADARGAMLGETSIADTKQSTETNMTTNSACITKVPRQNVDFASNNQKTSESELDFISIKDSGKELTKVFRPFAANPQKQQRYESFLQNKGEASRDSKTDRLNEWERERELAEFEQAAKLYRPLTGVMSDRFTHASEPDDATNPLSVVAKSSSNYGLATEEQIAAAKAGTFGALTRRQTSWMPESLVCKRFNIPDPNVVSHEKIKAEKQKVSYSIFSYMESSIHDKESFTKEQSKFSGSKSLLAHSKKSNPEPKLKDKKIKTENIISLGTNIENTAVNKRMTVAELFLKESEKDMQNQNQETQVTDTIEKFDKMDLYKSIFLSDSEDEQDIGNTEGNKSIDVNDILEKTKNIERNSSPPRGIFANIDFDEINSWRKNVDNKKSEESSNKIAPSLSKEEVKNNHTEGDEFIYGPKIPETLKKRLDTPNEVSNLEISYNKNDKNEVSSNSSEDSWVELDSSKKNKSKKKKKKSKTHRSKHKSKNKKKLR